MSGKVTRTVRNVDKMFSSIEVNGQEYTQKKKARSSIPSALAESTGNIQARAAASTQGEDVNAIELNNVRHNIKDSTVAYEVNRLDVAINQEVADRKFADSANLNTVRGEINNLDSALSNEINNLDRTLSDEISALDTKVSQEISVQLQKLDERLSGKVAEIEQLIPEQASVSNQLADKDFVNSSVSTNTAYFKGTFNSIQELEQITDVTNNDYAFVKALDESGNVVFKRYKYNADDSEWVYEYDLNNSSFTEEQWKAINSGITEEIVKNIDNIRSVNITKEEYEDLPEETRNNGWYWNVTNDSPPPFQIYFDIQMPVNFVYEQLPPALDSEGVLRTPADPNTLFNNEYVKSEWRKLDYDGAFFRADGGNASVFGSGLQAEGLPNITGKFNSVGMSGYSWGGVAMSDFGGAFIGGMTSTGGLTGNNGGTVTTGSKFDASKGETLTDGTVQTTAEVYGSSDHVTPRNYTVIKWIRVK